MSKTLAAVTTLAPSYPGYVNFTQNDDGSVVVTVRGAPTEFNGAAVCGQDCRPGSELCNNYCNQAPGKGPMAGHPPVLRHTKCGHVVAFVMTAAEWAALRAQVVATGTEPDLQEVLRLAEAAPKRVTAHDIGASGT